MDWKKIGLLKNLNRYDVWQIIFEFLDIKSVINGLSKSCKSFKYLSLLNLSHIKSICILPMSLDSVSSFTNLFELLKCEKTFFLKICSNSSIPPELPQIKPNKSVVRLKYKSKNGNFSFLPVVIRSLLSFSYFTLSGNPEHPLVTEKIVSEILTELKAKKMNYLKISKVTLDTAGFKMLKKFLKEKTPMVIILDFNCFYEKANNFQIYLAELWKNKWLLNIDFKLNGKILFSCTREFLAY